MADQLRVNDQMVDCARTALSDGLGALGNFPGLMKRIVKEDMWRERFVIRLGKVVTFDRFEDFVTTPPLEGMGTTLRNIENACRDDREVLVLLREPVIEHGGERTGSGPKPDPDDVQCYNVTLNNEPERHDGGGNSSSYRIRRLKRDAPEIADRLAGGDFKSVAEAYRAAGLEKPKSAVKELQGAWKKATAPERRAFLDWAATHMLDEGPAEGKAKGRVYTLPERAETDDDTPRKEGLG